MKSYFIISLFLSVTFVLIITVNWPKTCNYPRAQKPSCKTEMLKVSGSGHKVPRCCTAAGHSFLWWPWLYRRRALTVPPEQTLTCRDGPKCNYLSLTMSRSGPQPESQLQMEQWERINLLRGAQLLLCLWVECRVHHIHASSLFLFSPFFLKKNRYVVKTSS